MDNIEELLLASLDKVETCEARLLAWGLVDGSMNRDELAVLIDPLLDEIEPDANLEFYNADEVIDALLERKILFEFDLDEEKRYRSRMAETVRLMFYLRQLLPKHRGDQKWRNAPNLVSDFRFIRRRRRYPKRDVSVQEAISDMNEEVSEKYRQTLSEIFSCYGNDFKLSAFQVEATTRILHGFESQSSTATLVSAGTGSGKTIAFYLPALTRISWHILNDPSDKKWVKVLSIYPRIELLKDQFAEVFREARRMDEYLIKNGRRKIIIGTFFRSTPYSVESLNKNSGHTSSPEDATFSFLRCPSDGCKGKMLWKKKDQLDKIERLVCNSCETTIESDEIVLTRERLEKVSPDILFTTTEMLNQRMGDSRMRHLFGLGDKASYPVEMVLLDEVHTYSGTSGANVAYLLRRWKHIIGKPVNFVGLSATLNDGTRFFSKITSVPEYSTTEIEPRSSDMIEEGAEYMIALRGDPVSRTALLSTTVQAAMLLIRMLDFRDRPVSEGVFGERLFMFADNIDVINRMFFTMLDVEGRNSKGIIDNKRHPDGGLAILRESRPNTLRKRYGQDWQVPMEIGHSLNEVDRKHIERVMSMDPGMKDDKDIIVATASLEVGYNDPLVGGVIQHKAPRDIAQFLQRKGRAGRSRKMRPWTVVVLSDYGRDRLVYQGYDLLFDAQIPPKSLPIQNRYVERIQSVFATMDFLGQFKNLSSLGSVWINLSRPAKYPGESGRQKALSSNLLNILQNENFLNQYIEYLQNALQLEEDDIIPLLWDQPRPLLTEVLPTALRRLETGWKQNIPSAKEFPVQNSPLPEFVPPTLFSDLNLPEVKIDVNDTRYFDEDLKLMSIAQAMSEFAPGRVSRRYGVRHALDRYWLCPAIDSDNNIKEQTVELESFVDAEYLGNWKIPDNSGEYIEIPVYRPNIFKLQKPDNGILDTSNAQLQWRTQIVAKETGLMESPPNDNIWNAVIENVQFFTHRNLTPVEIRRMAIGSDANIRYLNGSSLNRQFSFELYGSKVALGFNMKIDAMCIKLKFPNSLWSELSSANNLRSRAIRTAYFIDKLTSGDLCKVIDNKFAREWLAQVLMTSISNEALKESISLFQATENIKNGDTEIGLVQTLDIIFQSSIVEELSEEPSRQDKLRKELEEWLSNPTVQSILFEQAEILWSPITEEWERWLRQKFAITTAAAALSAITSLCPDIDREGLLLDLDVGPREETDSYCESSEFEVWISESAPGGNGQIEEALQKYGEDPARFYNLLTASLLDNDLVLSDSQLQKYLSEIVENQDGIVSEATNAFRNSRSAVDNFSKFRELRETLAKEGFVCFHAFLVAIANRVLRPGSGPHSDKFFFNALKFWNDAEEKLGIELDARVIAYQLSKTSKLDEALDFDGLELSEENDESWRFGVIYGLLWPRGAQVRRSGLQIYSRFADLPLTEPLLVSNYLERDSETIDVESENFKVKCIKQLEDTGSVTVSCSFENSEKLSEALNFLATNKIDCGYLTAYSRITAIRRTDANYLVDIDLVEAKQ